MPAEYMTSDAGCVLLLSGTVDIFDSASLHDAAREAAKSGGNEVSIHLHAATAIDTSATQILLALRRATQRRGGRVLFCGAPRSITAFWTAGGLAQELSGER
jgi:anti-anti-sigma regulatory factor